MDTTPLLPEALFKSATTPSLLDQIWLSQETTKHGPAVTQEKDGHKYYRSKIWVPPSLIEEVV